MVKFYDTKRATVTPTEQIRRDYRNDPRLAMAQGLMRSGTDTSPVRSHWQGLNRALQAGLGAYMQKSARDEYQEAMATDKEQRAAMAQAILKGSQEYVQGPKTREILPPDGLGGPKRSENVSPYTSIIHALSGLDSPYATQAIQDYSLMDMQGRMVDQKEAAQKRELSIAQANERAQQLADYDRLRKHDLEDYTSKEEIKAKYATPSAPKTVRTAEGVFTLNPDGTLGNRLGSNYSDFGPVWQQGSDPKTGQPIQVNTKTGEIKAAPTLKPTGDQANAGLFATRMDAAEKILADPALVKEGMDWAERGIQGLPVVGDTMATNWMLSDEFKQYDQAKRDFINAVLRRESGAAIAESEFDNANKQYFPQASDSPELIEQKRRNRILAIEGIKAASGPSYDLIQKSLTDGIGLGGATVDGKDADYYARKYGGKKQQ